MAASSVARTSRIVTAGGSGLLGPGSWPRAMNGSSASSKRIGERMKMTRRGEPWSLHRVLWASDSMWSCSPPFHHASGATGSRARRRRTLLLLAGLHHRVVRGVDPVEVEGPHGIDLHHRLLFEVAIV